MGPKSEEYKRDLPPPSGVADILHGVLLQISRKYLFIDTQKKVVFYASLVVIGSLFPRYLLPFPERPYLAEKRNVLNQWMVKLGWGWTFILTSAFVTLTSLVYSANQWRNTRQQLARLLVATGIWYTATSTFVRIEHRTGVCTVDIPLDAGYRTCVGSGGNWLPGFDISGHCFLLIYCCLIISEEVRVFKSWDAIKVLLDDAPLEPVQLALLSKDEIKVVRELYADYTGAIKALFMALAGLHFIWDLMLLMTVLYHHTIAHKVAGAAVALLAWQLTYKLWFTLSASPGRPGHCSLRYVGYRRSP